MIDRAALKTQIRQAFAATPPPDRGNLRGSNEGDEPYLLEDEFEAVPAWDSLEPGFLDDTPAGFGSALSFFSRDAFRYYLPAYLIADIDEALDRADPSFHLWHGFDDAAREQPVNPRRYGAWSWFDAKAERFAVFAREEVEAIVSYLRHRAQREEFSRGQIEQALRNFWVPRLETLARRRG